VSWRKHDEGGPVDQPLLKETLQPTERKKVKRPDVEPPPRKARELRRDWRKKEVLSARVVQLKELLRVLEERMIAQHAAVKNNTMPGESTTS